MRWTPEKRRLQAQAATDAILREAGRLSREKQIPQEEALELVWKDHELLKRLHDEVKGPHGSTQSGGSDAGTV